MSKVRALLDGETVSYAQNREDIIIATILGFVPGSDYKGFYVDVGANDPTIDSVTRYFYDRGWSGVNIEPSVHYAKLLSRARQRDTNLQIAIAENSDEAVLREYVDRSGWHTLSKDTQDSTDHKHLRHNDYVVPTLPLVQVLRKHAKNTPIDFLKIDVEGLEKEVIASNDWKQFRPKLIVIEAIHKGDTWRPLLLKEKYQQVFSDGINEYYVSDAHASRVDLGNYPKIAMEGGGVISYQEALRREHLLSKQAEKFNKRIEKLDKKHQDLQAYISRYPARIFAAKLYRKFFPRAKYN